MKLVEKLACAHICMGFTHPMEKPLRVMCSEASEKPIGALRIKLWLGAAIQTGGRAKRSFLFTGLREDG